MERGEEFIRAILAILFVCGGVVACGAGEPNEQDIQLASEKMQQLRQVYKEVQQAEADLVRITKVAEQKEPLLCPTKEALKEMKAFLESQDHQRFQKYLNNSKDRKAAYWLYENCKTVFGQNKSAELLNDPNQERLIREPMIYYFRHQSPTSLDLPPSFDTNDPNSERLWENIKQVYFRRAPEEYLQQKREYYVKEKGVPEWLPDYAGNMAFADGMINMYEGGMCLLTPQELQDAEKRLLGLYHKMSLIYSGWSQMRHLLADQYTEEEEAVIRAAQEHMHLWPTVHRSGAAIKD